VKFLQTDSCEAGIRSRIYSSGMSGLLRGMRYDDSHRRWKNTNRYISLDGLVRGSRIVFQSIIEEDPTRLESSWSEGCYSKLISAFAS
jgi:hypothetical protein